MSSGIGNEFLVVLSVMTTLFPVLLKNATWNQPVMASYRRRLILGTWAKYSIVLFVCPGELLQPLGFFQISFQKLNITKDYKRSLM